MQLAITIPLAKILNTWIDETYTLHTTGQSLQHAMYQANHFELQPPLFFVLLTLWRGIDHSIFFARLFSVVCAALLVYCAAQLSARYAPRLNPAWAAWLVALNPATIWAANEIRVYAFGGLLSALLMWKFYDGYLADMPSSRARVVHVFIAIAALYTQYFLGFLLLGQFCALLVLRQWTMARYFVASMVVVGVGLVPIGYVLHQQLVESTSLFLSTESLRSLLFDVYEIAFSYVLPIGKLIGATGAAHAGRYLAIVGVLAAVAVFYVRKRLHNRTNVMAAWAIAVVSCAILVLIFYVTKRPFGSRYEFMTFVPVMCAALATVALQRNKKYVLATWAAIFAVGSFTTLYSSYQPLAKSGDWMRVAAYIQSAEKSDEPILGFQTETALSLQDYYHGKNFIVAVPRPIDFTAEWRDSWILHSERDIERDLASVPGVHSYIWVVNTNECTESGVDYHCPLFEHFLTAHYRVVLQKDFYHSHVRLLRSKKSAERDETAR